MTVMAICIILSVIPVILFVSTRPSTEPPIDEEERYRIVNLLRKTHYAIDLLFDFQIYIDGESRVTHGVRAWDLLNPDSRYHQPFYTDVVFVHTEEEGQGFPENVIVAWPRTGGGIETEIFFMHQHANMTEAELSQRSNPRPVVTLEEFGLSYPLTRADLVDNWEKVMELRIALGLFHPSR